MCDERPGRAFNIMLEKMERLANMGRGQSHMHEKDGIGKVGEKRERRRREEGEKKERRGREEGEQNSCYASRHWS
jgi:hypothetical protein